MGLWFQPDREADDGRPRPTAAVDEDDSSALWVVAQLRDTSDRTATEADINVGEFITVSSQGAES